MALEGQVVLITGAARGIGRYVSGTFARAGTRLAVADVDAGHLSETAAELRETGAQVFAVEADVRQEESVERMMAGVVGHYGQLDVLVNNAGIATHARWAPLWPPIRDMDEAFRNRVIGTNLGGTFLCTKHALRHMRPRRSGHIINVHGGGTTQPPGACAYVTSKEAIRTFSRFVAEEEREANVCIVIVSPGGAIATEDATEEAKRALPGPEAVGDVFVQAAQAGMEDSGKLFRAWQGKLAGLEAA